MTLRPMVGLRQGTILISLLTLVACGDKAPPTPGADRSASMADEVRLTETQLSAAGVVVDTVTERALVLPVEGSAQIEAPPDRVARIGSRVAGRVVSVTAGIGDRVRAGAVLAVVEAPDLARATADYLSTLAAAKLARTNAERERALFERRISAEREWRQAEADAVRAESERAAAENRLHSLGIPDDQLAALRGEGHFSSTVNLTAPLAGVVVDRTASLGQSVEPADMLFTIMDLRDVWIVMDVFEKDLRLVREGQIADVRVAAYPDRRFRGRVANIAATLEPGSRTAKVRIVLPNSDLLLKPGMFAEVEVLTSTGPLTRGLVVPTSAVQRDGADVIVFVARDSGRFAVRRIETGLTTCDWIHVVRGLSRGDRIAVRGVFALKSERRKGELGEGDEH